MNVAESIAELNPLDNLRQAVPAIEFAPFLLRRHHQPESHGESRVPAQAPLGSLGAVPDGGERASTGVKGVPEWVWWTHSALDGADVFPVVGRELQRHPDRDA